MPDGLTIDDVFSEKESAGLSVDQVFPEPEKPNAEPKKGWVPPQFTMRPAMLPPSGPWVGSQVVIPAVPPSTFLESVAPIPRVEGKTTMGKIGAGVVNSLATIPNFLTSPIGVATAPLALASAPVKLAASLGLLGGAVKPTYEAAKRAVETKDPQDITEAIGTPAAMLLAGKAMSSLGKLAPKTVTETTPPVPPEAMPTTPTETGLRPAIRLVGGEVKVGDAGKTHPDIIRENKLKAEDIDQRGFVTKDGKFLDREQAAVTTGEPTLKEPGRQHSTDLPEAKPKAEPLPPEQQAVEQQRLAAELEPEKPTQGNIGIAARVTDKMAQAGRIEEVSPGEGVSPEQAVLRGRDLISKGANPESVVEAFNQTKSISADDMAVARAHAENLARASNAAADKFGTDSPEYKAAWKAESDWIQKIKPMQTEWHKVGQAQQGEVEPDTGTFHGLRRAYFEQTGKEFTPKQETEAQAIADKAKLADEQVLAAKTRLLEQLAKSADQEVQKIWKYAKDTYIDKGVTDFTELVHKLATDLGMDADAVRKILAAPKGAKKITNEMYTKMSNRRRVEQQARIWLKNQQTPGWLRFIRKVPQAFFIDKVFGHGTVGMITHAGLNMFDPMAWKQYFPNFIRQFGLVFKPAYHERLMQDLTHDTNFTVARRAGLINDPFKYADDYQNAAMKMFMGKLGGLVGNRGFDALKLFRQARFNQEWNRAPESLKTPDYAKMLADSINHASGVVKMPFREWSNWTFFAPKLESSRWAWMMADPAKAGKVFANWRNATPAERAFAMRELKQKAAVAGTYYGLLALNQGILSAANSDQKINLTEPKRGDFMAFKILGHNVGVVGPMLGMVRLFANLAHDAFGHSSKLEKLTPRGERIAETVGSYARGKLSPFAGQAYNVLSQSDFQGRPLPFSEDVAPAYLRKRGEGTYEWPEYLTQELAPIPAEEAIKEVWSDQGMSEPEMTKYLKGLGVFIGAGTGARISKDYNQ